MSNEMITLYHAPHTRSTGAVILMEELGADYDLKILNMKADEQRKAAFMAVNPLAKVPAVVHRGGIVTEQVAVYIYLADLFPEAGLAPALDDPLRGPYLRWLAFYGASFEPAVVDKAMKREPAPARMSPYGDYESVIGTLKGQLATGPYLFGERLTAADILWGNALNWTMSFGIVDKDPVFTAYAERIISRSSFRKVSEMDARLAAEHEAALTA